MIYPPKHALPLMLILLCGLGCKSSENKTPKVAPEQKQPLANAPKHNNLGVKKIEKLANKTSKIIRFNRQQIGELIQTEAQTKIIWHGDPRQELRFGPHIQTVEMIQIVDLSKDQKLGHNGPQPWSSITSRKAKQPALLIRARRVEPLKNIEALKKKQPGVRPRKRVEIRWLLVPIHALYNTLWQFNINVQHADGFGGYKVKNLALSKIDNVWTITGTRQDQQPARSSRCKRSPPYTVTWAKKSDRFIKQPVANKRGSPCRN